MATIKDVALKAGVSISTVSRVINHPKSVVKEKCDAVSQAMKELDYIPNIHAQALVSKTSMTVGFLFSGKEGSNFSNILCEIENIVEKNSGRIIVQYLQDSDYNREIKLLGYLLASACDSSIIHSNTLKDVDLVKYLRFHPAAIILGRRVLSLADRCVYCDYYRTGYKVGQYLLDLGHKCIGFIQSKHLLPKHQQLLEGFKNAVELRGVMFSMIKDVAYTDASIEGGYKAVGTLMKESDKKYTSLVVFSDAAVPGVLQYLQENGKKVPQDVSLLSCEDQGISESLSPEITAMKEPLVEMVQSATALSFSRVQEKKRIAGYDKENVQSVFQSRLIIRNSVISCIDG